MPRERDRAVFLDRDGTLNEDRGNLKAPAELVMFPETVGALKRLHEQFRLFVVTNQPGIALGVLSIEDVERVNAQLIADLAREGVPIEKVYVCPHQKPDGCGCRKPKPYFLREAAAEFGIDLERSFVIGDHPHDVELARNVGATGIYVLTGHGARHRGDLRPDTTVVRNIGEAADWIGRAERGA